MTFRSCSYFVTISDLGTINAAAKKLYVSQQSLSEHILKLEKELETKLFIRENPLRLTAAGEAFYRLSKEILSALDTFQAELNEIKAAEQGTLVVGCLDFSAPDFLPELMSEYIIDHPNAMIRTCEHIREAEIPSDIQLLFSSRKIPGFHCEKLMEDTPAVYVSDELLKRVYGNDWHTHLDQLKAGDLSAIKECPFLHHRNERLEKRVFENQSFLPKFLPVTGGSEILERLCISGQAAMLTFLAQSKKKAGFPPAYALSNIQQNTNFALHVCYRLDKELSKPAQRFLEIVRRHFQRALSIQKCR